MKHEAEQRLLNFLPDEEVKNKSIDVPWKKSETDKMLDLYFGGHHPNRIAQCLGRNPKAVKRRLEQFVYNEDGRAERYEQRQRHSRKGKRITENERLMIDAHRERKIPIEVTAGILAREISEIHFDGTSQDRVGPSSLDLVLAHRYIHFVYKTPVISNNTYDNLKAEEIEYGKGGKELRGDPKDCPRYIKTLALFLVERYGDKF